MLFPPVNNIAARRLQNTYQVPAHRYVPRLPQPGSRYWTFAPYWKSTKRRTHLVRYRCFICGVPGLLQIRILARAGGYKPVHMY